MQQKYLFILKCLYPVFVFRAVHKIFSNTPLNKTKLLLLLLLLIILPPHTDKTSNRKSILESTQCPRKPDYLLSISVGASRIGMGSCSFDRGSTLTEKDLSF